MTTTTTYGIRNRRTMALTLFFISILAASFTQAQVVYNETFDIGTPSTSLPLGWSQGKFGAGTDPENFWDRVNVGANPACAPHAGTAMMRFQCTQITSPEASFLVSKRFAMNGVGAQLMPVGGANFSFWFHRDNTPAVTGFSDRIQVYINTTPDLGGTPLLLLENVSTSNVINRSTTLAPVSANGWQQYFYTIPNAAPWNGASVYVIILGTSNGGNNLFVDDFSITSYPRTQTYTFNSAIVVPPQNTATTGAGALNQEILCLRMTMDGEFNPRVLTNMTFNTNGSTNPPTDISMARLYWTGGSSTFNSATAIPLGTYSNPWLTNFTFLTAPNANYTGPANFNGLVHGDNYFWLQYDIAAGAVGGNVVDAEWSEFNIPALTSVFTQTQAGNRLIDLVYCIPTYWTGTAWNNYNNNDYIYRVTCAGNGVPAPGINNLLNWITQSCGPGGADFNCAVPPFPKSCPFQRHTPDYELFAEVAGKTTSFTANGTTVYPIQIQVGTYGSGNSVAAWIDYNHDGFFTPAEKITQSPSPGLGALGVHNGSFTVPVTALPGKTRMRVREDWINYNIDPCNHRSYGETEDYIVTILPDCPGVPGWTTWLGLTSNWADPSNWCPAVAPINGNPLVNVRIPGGPSGAYTYVKPVITSGVQARAIKLRIESNDTLLIDAMTNSNLIVTDSLKIWTPTSTLKVNTSFRDTCQLMNGTNSRVNDSPLNSSERSRAFMLFTQADLLLQGLTTNDIVDTILIHLNRDANGNPYKNLTITMYYANSAFNFTPGPTGTVPVPFGPAPVQVFSGDINSATFVPVINTDGTITIPLSTTFQWNGSANQLVVELCYDNTGFPTTGTNDDVKFTQTTSLRKYMVLENLSTKPIPACTMIPANTYTATATVSGTAGTNTITVSAANAANIYPGAIIVSGTSPSFAANGGMSGNTVLSVVGTTVTMIGNVINTFTNGTVVFYDVNNTAINYRPNVTFKFTRPYIKYPISVGGHWENNGSFIPAISKVTMTGPTANQQIGGTSGTTFYDLDINNNAHVQRNTDFVVTNDLTLINGRLKLNNGLVTLTNPALSALTRTSGYIQSDHDLLASNAYPFGRLRWSMGTTTGLRTIPFINNSGVYIPLEYTIDSGTHDVILGTYNTLPNNTNLPLPEVTNVFGYANTSGWGSSGDAVVDRFYLVKDTLGIAPQADLRFRYSNPERAFTNPTGAATMRAQRWINASDMWEFPFVTVQNYTPGNPDNVEVVDFTGFAANSWWTIVGEANPLPVSMLEFIAEKQQDRVMLKWTTASEINNSHFDIERTVDNVNFDFIGRVESQGNGNNIQEYVAYDTRPLLGLQYYYLRQYDVDGRSESFGPVSAKFTRQLPFNIVSTSVSTGDKGLTVVFNYNSQEPYSYRIMDMTGRIIVANDRNTAVEGVNVLEIDASLAKGAYHIVLQNNSEVVSKKFFY